MARPIRRRANRVRARRRTYVKVARTRPPVRPAKVTGPVDPFRHVVLLMLENRSFDHMVGALQAVVPDLDGVPSAGPPRTNPDVAGTLVNQSPVATPIVNPDPSHDTENVLDQIAEG